MKIIAHRGLLVGPDPKAENQLDTIDEALTGLMALMLKLM